MRQFSKHFKCLLFIFALSSLYFYSSGFSTVRKSLIPWFSVGLKVYQAYHGLQNSMNMMRYRIPYSSQEGQSHLPLILHRLNTFLSGLPVRTRNQINLSSGCLRKANILVDSGGNLTIAGKGPVTGKYYTNGHVSIKGLSFRPSLLKCLKAAYFRFDVSGNCHPVGKILSAKLYVPESEASVCSLVRSHGISCLLMDEEATGTCYPIATEAKQSSFKKFIIPGSQHFDIPSEEEESSSDVTHDSTVMGSNSTNSTRSRRSIIEEQEDIVSYMNHYKRISPHRSRRCTPLLGAIKLALSGTPCGGGSVKELKNTLNQFKATVTSNFKAQKAMIESNNKLLGTVESEIRHEDSKISTNHEHINLNDKMILKTSAFVSSLASKVDVKFRDLESTIGSLVTALNKKFAIINSALDNADKEIVAESLERSVDELINKVMFGLTERIASLSKTSIESFIILDVSEGYLDVVLFWAEPVRRGELLGSTVDCIHAARCYKGTLLQSRDACVWDGKELRFLTNLQYESGYYLTFGAPRKKPIRTTTRSCPSLIQSGSKIKVLKPETLELESGKLLHTLEEEMIFHGCDDPVKGINECSGNGHIRLISHPDVVLNQAVSLKRNKDIMRLSIPINDPPAPSGIPGLEKAKEDFVKEIRADASNKSKLEDAYVREDNSLHHDETIFNHQEDEYVSNARKANKSLEDLKKFTFDIPSINVSGDNIIWLIMLTLSAVFNWAFTIFVFAKPVKAVLLCNGEFDAMEGDVMLVLSTVFSVIIAFKLCRFIFYTSKELKILKMGMYVSHGALIASLPALENKVQEILAVDGAESTEEEKTKNCLANLLFTTAVVSIACVSNFIMFLVNSSSHYAKHSIIPKAVVTHALMAAIASNNGNAGWSKSLHIDTSYGITATLLLIVMIGKIADSRTDLVMCILLSSLFRLLGLPQAASWLALATSVVAVFDYFRLSLSEREKRTSQWREANLKRQLKKEALNREIEEALGKEVCQKWKRGVLEKDESSDTSEGIPKMRKRCSCVSVYESGGSIEDLEKKVKEGERSLCCRLLGTPANVTTYLYIGLIAIAISPLTIPQISAQHLPTHFPAGTRQFPDNTSVYEMCTSPGFVYQPKWGDKGIFCHCDTYHPTSPIPRSSRFVVLYEHVKPGNKVREVWLPHTTNGGCDAPNTRVCVIKPGQYEVHVMTCSALWARCPEYLNTMQNECEMTMDNYNWKAYYEFPTLSSVDVPGDSIVDNSCQFSEDITKEVTLNAKFEDLTFNETVCQISKKEKEIVKESFDVVVNRSSVSTTLRPTQLLSDPPMREIRRTRTPTSSGQSVLRSYYSFPRLQRTPLLNPDDLDEPLVFDMRPLRSALMKYIVDDKSKHLLYDMPIKIIYIKPSPWSTHYELCSRNPHALILEAQKCSTFNPISYRMYSSVIPLDMVLRYSNKEWRTYFPPGMMSITAVQDSTTVWALAVDPTVYGLAEHLYPPDVCYVWWSACQGTSRYSKLVNRQKWAQIQPHKDVFYYKDEDLTPSFVPPANNPAVAHNFNVFRFMCPHKKRGTWVEVSFNERRNSCVLSGKLLPCMTTCISLFDLFPWPYALSPNSDTSITPKSNKFIGSSRKPIKRGVYQFTLNERYTYNDSVKAFEKAFATKKIIPKKGKFLNKVCIRLAESKCLKDWTNISRVDHSVFPAVNKTMVFPRPCSTNKTEVENITFELPPIDACKIKRIIRQGSASLEAFITKGGMGLGADASPVYSDFFVDPHNFPVGKCIQHVMIHAGLPSPVKAYTAIFYQPALCSSNGLIRVGSRFLLYNSYDECLKYILHSSMSVVVTNSECKLSISCNTSTLTIRRKVQLNVKAGGVTILRKLLSLDAHEPRPGPSRLRRAFSFLERSLRLGIGASAFSFNRTTPSPDPTMKEKPSKSTTPRHISEYHEEYAMAAFAISSVSGIIIIFFFLCYLICSKKYMRKLNNLLVSSNMRVVNLSKIEPFDVDGSVRMVAVEIQLLNPRTGQRNTTMVRFGTVEIGTIVDPSLIYYHLDCYAGQCHLILDDTKPHTFRKSSCLINSRRVGIRGKFDPERAGDLFNLIKIEAGWTVDRVSLYLDDQHLGDLQKTDEIKSSGFKDWKGRVIENPIHKSRPVRKVRKVKGPEEEEDEA